MKVTDLRLKEEGTKRNMANDNCLKEDGLKEEDTFFVVVYRETREGNRGEQG
jgi:hypothetical protein